MRASIAERLAAWYCRHNERDTPLRIDSDIYRLVPDGREYVSSLRVAEFECRNGDVTVKRTLRSFTRAETQTGGAK
jgi:hypothetical protein